MTARSGGLWLGAAGDGAGILREALQIFPGARVEALRRRSGLHERMRKAAYLVLPAVPDPRAEEDEPLRVLVEAFACGLPVIGARLPPIADWVEPGRNGLLFEPGSARELARRLAWAEAFPERMRQMGECAQADYHARFVADWNWQRLFGDRRRQPRMSLS
jgi:glycosyltransferase involved in cell wall biosynthesis